MQGERRQRKRPGQFEIYHLTGRRGGAEFKFNPWHYPLDGRFTFSGRGDYYGAGGQDRSGTSGKTRNQSPSQQRARPIARNSQPQREAGRSQEQSPSRQRAKPFVGEGGSFGGGGTSGAWDEPGNQSRSNKPGAAAGASAPVRPSPIRQRGQTSQPTVRSTQQTDRATPASGGCRATAINMRSTAPTAHAVYPAISPPTPRRRDRKPPSARQACRIGYHRITAATMSRDGSMAPRTTSTISHKMRISTVAATRPWRINGRRSFEPDEPCGWTSVPPMSAIADVLP